MSAPAFLLPSHHHHPGPRILTAEDIQNVLLSSDRCPNVYLPKRVASRPDMKCPAKLTAARLTKIAGSSTQAQILNLDLARQIGSRAGEKRGQPRVEQRTDQERAADARRRSAQRKVSKLISAKVVKNILHGPRAADRQFLDADGSPLKVFDISYRDAWTIPAELISSAAFKDGAKLTYGIVAAYARTSGAAFMERKTIARHLSCSVESVSIYLGQLVVGKLLHPAGKRGKVTVYKLLYNDLFQVRFGHASPQKDRTFFTTKDRTFFTTKDKEHKIQTSSSSSEEALGVGSSFVVPEINQAKPSDLPGLIDEEKTSPSRPEPEQPQTPSPIAGEGQSSEAPRKPVLASPCRSQAGFKAAAGAKEIETARKSFSELEWDLVEARIRKFEVVKSDGQQRPIEITPLLTARVLNAGKGASVEQIGERFTDRLVYVQNPHHASNWPRDEGWFISVIERTKFAKLAKSVPMGNMQSEDSKPAFEMEDVRRYLQGKADALKDKPEYAAIGGELQQLADDAEAQCFKLEALEGKLTSLEERMSAIAKEGLSGEDLLAARRELDTALKPYRGKMTPDQITMLERQFLEKRALENTDLPRLSLFYLRC